MTPDDRGLDALLESLAGGEAVDWADAEARLGQNDRPRLRALRDVSRVADFHRSLQRDLAGGLPGRDVARWNELIVLERVGAGASGDVYRAWDPALQREVALKVLRPREGATTGELLEEARALARVRDRHVVLLHGAAEHEGRVGLWMEFVNGPTLEAEIARRGSLPPGEVARIGAEIARALAAVHAAGAIHRDVKPANVMLDRDGRAVLMDFGLGRRAGSSSAGSPFSGTPMFMSPQRLAGQRATPADDVYALGASLWFALSGTPPYPVRTLEELRHAAPAGPAERLAARRPDAPPALVATIERAMASSVPDRFASAAAMASSLEAATRSAEPGAGAAEAPAKRRRPSTRGVVAATLLAIAIAAVAAWFAFRDRVAAPTATAPSPAPPASAILPAGAYDVSATFIKRTADGDVRLQAGDRVAPGDRLSLEVSASRPVWAYVLNADDRGETYLLFPQPLFDRANPLPSDSLLMLPGTRGGREQAWTVTSRGGREHMLVVVSPERVPELEAELSRLPAPVPGRAVEYTRVTTGTVERLRGMGGVDEVPAARVSGPSVVFDRVRALAGRERGIQGTWVRQMVLQNPLR